MMAVPTVANLACSAGLSDILRPAQTPAGNGPDLEEEATWRPPQSVGGVRGTDPKRSFSEWQAEFFGMGTNRNVEEVA
jgi:hypothetical protein